MKKLNKTRVLSRIALAILASTVLLGCTTILGAYPSSFNVIGKPVEKNSDVSFFDMARYHIKLYIFKDDDISPTELLAQQQDYADKTKSYYGPESMQYAGRLADLSDTYSRFGDRVEQLRYAKQAYDIAIRGLDKDHVHLGWYSNRLSGAFYHVGDNEKALYYALKATEIPKGESADEELSRAGSYSNLANIYQAKKDYKNAIVYHEKALSISEYQDGESSIRALADRSNLAGAYSDDGLYDQSLSVAQKGLRIIEEQNSPSIDFIKYRFLFMVGKAYLNKGDTVKAMQKTEEALSVLRSVQDISRTDMAEGLVQSAILYDQVGDAGRYFTLIKEAVDYSGRAFPKDSPVYAYYLTHLAKAYASNEDYPRAKTITDQVIKIYTQAQDAKPTELADAYLLASSLEQLMGHDGEAERYVRTANSIIDKFKLNDPELLLENLKQMAWLEISRENRDAESPSITNNNIHKKSQSIITNALSLAYASKDKMSQALYDQETYSLLRMQALFTTNTDLGIAIFKKFVNEHQAERAVVAELGRKYLDSYTNSQIDDYAILSSMLSMQGRHAEALVVLNMLKQHEFFEFIRRAKNEQSHENQAIEYSPEESIVMSELERIEIKIDNTSKVIGHLQAQLLISSNSEDESRLQLALKEKDGLTLKLKELLASAKPSNKSKAGLSKSLVAGEIKEQLALSNKSTVYINYWISKDRDSRTLNVLVNHSKWEKYVSIPLSIEQEDLLEVVLPSVSANPKIDPKPAALAAYKLMLAPIAGVLQKAKVEALVVTLNGALRYLPVASLYDGAKYLIENYDVAIYNNLGDNNLLEKDSKEWRVSAMGVTRPIGAFPALPGVRDEIEGIVKQEGSGGLHGVIYLDQNFTKSALVESSKNGYGALHIASHFVFSPGTEANSFLLLGDGTQLTLGDLRMENISFKDVDLVTLSACETGAGGGISGDGKEIDGLSGVLQHKGARAVIATLWPVADKSTSILMRNMYRRKSADNLTKAEALRSAQLDLLYGNHESVKPISVYATNVSSPPSAITYKTDPNRPYAHPFYWAPFILMGNWH